jgi:hypothetical protein
MLMRKNIGKTSKNVDKKILAILLKKLTKKMLANFRKMLTGKNVGNTSEKC